MVICCSHPWRVAAGALLLVKCKAEPCFQGQGISVPRGGFLGRPSCGKQGREGGGGQVWQPPRVTAPRSPSQREWDRPVGVLTATELCGDRVLAVSSEVSECIGHPHCQHMGAEWPALLPILSTIKLRQLCSVVPFWRGQRGHRQSLKT